LNQPRVQPEPCRVLSFDGGGVHALSYLPILDHLERYLGSKIADGKHFQLLVGTSTGTIVAAALKLGRRPSEIIELYCRHASSIFTPLKPWNRVFHKYSAEGLRQVLLTAFKHPDAKKNRCLRWSEFQDLAAAEHPNSPELVVTLWNSSTAKIGYLSTNRQRPGQELTLYEASVADIITSCCSAPYFFPPRAFRSGSPNPAVYCDGGIAGLNNPSVYATAIVIEDLRRNGPLPPLHVFSFGAGKQSGELRIEEMIRWTALDAMLNTINALMSSSTVLADRFYEATGSTLGIKCLRTNQPRERSQKLDDVASIPWLLRNYKTGQVTYRLLGVTEATQDETHLLPFEFERLCADEFGLVGSCCEKDVVWRCPNDCADQRHTRAQPQSTETQGRDSRPSLVPSSEVRASWLTNRTLLTYVGIVVSLVAALFGAVGVSNYFRTRATVAERQMRAERDAAQKAQDDAEIAAETAREARGAEHVANVALDAALGRTRAFAAGQFPHLKDLVKCVRDQIAVRPRLLDSSRKILATLELEIDQTANLNPSLQDEANLANAIAEEIIGDLGFDNGSTDDAASYYDKALGLVLKASADPQAQLDLAVAYRKVGDANARKGLLGKASKCFSNSLEILNDVAKKDPAHSTQIDLDLAIVHAKIANLSMLKEDIRGANEQAALGLSIVDKLKRATDDTTDSTYSFPVRREYSRATRQRGEISMRDTGFNKAVGYFNDALQAANELITAGAVDPETELEVATCRAELAGALAAQGDLEAAQANYDAAKEIAIRLAENDPLNTRPQFLSAVISDGFGDMAIKQRNFADALRCFLEAEDQRERLYYADVDPRVGHHSNAQAQRLVAITWAKVAQAERCQQDFGKAVLHDATGLALLGDLLFRGRLVESSYLEARRLMRHIADTMRDWARSGSVGDAASVAALLGAPGASPNVLYWATAASRCLPRAIGAWSDPKGN
jgi:uncharacterized protein